MKRKNIFVYIVVGIALFLLGLFTGVLFFSKNKELGDHNVLPVSIVSIADSSEPLYTISGEYPLFPSLPDTFNRAIQSEIEKRLSEFKKNSQENLIAREATMPESERTTKPDHPFFFRVQWEGTQLNSKFVSFVLYFNSFEGGANARQELKTFNFDVTQKKPLSVKDLFPDDANYLLNVSEYTRENLKAQIASFVGASNVPEAMIYEGTKPTEENFSNFTFDDNRIVFYFQKYQVAPGAMGEQKVIMVRPRL